MSFEKSVVPFRSYLQNVLTTVIAARDKAKNRILWGRGSFQVTSNTYKSIKPKKTNNKKKKNNTWKKIRRQKSIMSAGVMQSKKLPKGMQ